MRINRLATSLSLVGVLVVAGCSRPDDSAELPDTVATSSSLVSTSTPSSSSSSVASSSSVPSTSTPSSSSSTSTAPPTTEAITTTTATTTTTTLPPTTTLAPGACPALAALPAGSVESGSKLIDVDANGVTDTVRTYAIDGSPTAGDWHVRIELAAGGGVDVALDDDPAPGAVKVLGGTYIGSNVDPGPGGARPAIFVTTGAGASASVVSLFRLDGCSLVVMGAGSFTVGAGVTHAENLRCDGVAGASLLVYQQINLNGDGVTFDVTDTPYTRTNNDLTIYGSGPQTTNQPTMPAVATLIDCPGVDHP